uniref:Uncharacterized protein n=1 Tax=Vespula pensylvanica TaxID=30213 RepID=A0A834N789_VESPE|nr:hypothetical protein H0235_016500 [Vespula pensylvanica]
MTRAIIISSYHGPWPFISQETRSKVTRMQTAASLSDLFSLGFPTLRYLYIRRDVFRSTNARCYHAEQRQSRNDDDDDDNDDDDNDDEDDEDDDALNLEPMNVLSSNCCVLSYSWQSP